MEIACSIIRGGTTKGIFIQDRDLSADPQQRAAQIFALFGTPHHRQIDGLGGADPLTSKLALVSASERPGIDVDYESFEVGIAEPTLNNTIMCGNLAAGVGYFAIQQGLVKVTQPETKITIYSRNNGTTIVSHIPCDAEGPRQTGDFSINGVAGTAPRVRLQFQEPAGSVTGHLLPMNAPVSQLTRPGLPPIDYSLVDAGTLYAFIQADKLGVSGHETVAELDCKPEFKKEIHDIRRGIVEHYNQHSHERTDGSWKKVHLELKDLKIAILAPKESHDGEADIVARVINPVNVHKAYAVSGGICLAAAAAIGNTVANQIFRVSQSPSKVVIRHPSGTMNVIVDWSVDNREVIVHSAEVSRTARILMRGFAQIPSGVK